MSKFNKQNRFSTPWDDEYWMESNGFHCGFNMPKALVSVKASNGEDIPYDLPEYNWRKSYLVDEYPACPNSWMRSEGKLASYFVPIVEGDGMWLDFNKNAKHSHHVAVVVSIQGVNAITGMPCENPNLEQYIEFCPKHNVKFGANRYCEQCGFKWPKQNYISTTVTPDGNFWLDGFRAANGAVCQYILTEKTMQGVASNIIGSKRVYAIGISFFLSKDIKQRQYVNISDDSYNFANFNSVPMGWENRSSDCFDETRSSKVQYSSDNITVVHHAFSLTTDKDNSNVDDALVDGINCNLGSGGMSAAPVAAAAAPDQTKSFSSTPMDFAPMDFARYRISEAKVYSKKGSVPDSITPVRTKNIEIGAGANIRQVVYDDTETLDFWRDQPESILTINYCLESEAIRILKQGRVSKEGDPRGFLKNVPTGNETVKEGV